MTLEHFSVTLEHFSVKAIFGRTPGRRALRGLALSEGSSGPEPFLANKTNYMR